ncbi:bifunctional DNA primase/polymerase [Alicyclobacillus herbarius]|uniref:bifunctional DNA primase/polymerase n=1 Tax=Alicyclobacillus herbarius TaxID=122960 RepID=UPI000405244E|nr:bifunctional DNA primase/polymerase [Alicyclobacillus herbarius]
MVQKKSPAGTGQSNSNVNSVSHRVTVWQYAVRYAQQGWPVFPCQAGGKRPLTRHGYKDATTELERIDEWACAFPNANLAVATGRVSKVWVLDIDLRHGGMVNWRELVTEHASIAPTWCVRTGGGGWHLYFRYSHDAPIGCGVGSGRLQGIDWRGDGGYVLVPPSRTEQAYAWVVGPGTASVVEAPHWLVDLLSSSKSIVDESVQFAPSRTELSRLNELRAIAQGVSEGVRNTAASRLCGYLLRHRVDPYIVQSLMIAWNFQNRPPLPHNELLRVVDSIAVRELFRRQGDSYVR